MPPSTAMATTRPHQATVEDCLSDDDHGHGHGVAIEPFTPEPSPGKANVRTKRSNPEDMGTDKTPTSRALNNLDVKSDSGYSSQSVAGMSSADSAASAASSQPSQRSPLTVPAVPSPTPTQKPLRPAHSRQQSAQGELRYTLPRRESQSHASRPRPAERVDRAQRRSHAPPPPPPPPPAAAPPPPPPAPRPRRRDSRNGDSECTKPGCTTCGPGAVDPRPRPSRRQSMHRPMPADSAPDVSYHPHVYDTRSQVSDPAQYPGSSPREDRLHRMYHNSQGGPVVQPAISRRLSTTNRPARPTSYHGDSNPNWQQSGMHSPHPSSPYEHRPPLSKSAWGNVPYPPYQMPPYQPHGPSPAYFQAQQMQPPREHQRPPLQVRTSTFEYAPAPPVVQIERTDRHKMPSARYHPNAVPAFALQQQQQQQPRIGYRNQEQDDSESDFDSESESEEEPELPPQRAPRGASHRPSLRHAKTTPAAPSMPEARRPQTIVIPEQRHPRVDRNHDPRSARRTSMSRPSLVPSIKSQSAYDTPQAHVLVEGSRSSRRESVQTYDKLVPDHRRIRQRGYNEAVSSKRSSKAYDTVAVGHDYERNYHDDDEEPEPVARPLHRRRDTDADPRRKPNRPVEVRQAQAVAEDYINSKRGGGEALADVSYELAKTRSSRNSGGPSEAESSRSRGSDNNGEIRFRIAGDAPVILSLNGDVDGRLVQLLPIENGMNEVVISSNGRGGESTYRSEVRSVRGERRAITSAAQARRDAEEELTERSSQSSRRRRETRSEKEPRRVLHRSNRRKERNEPEYQY